jgi:CBS domain-containing protein
MDLGERIMILVKQLLDSKGSDVWSIHPDRTVYDALELMEKRNIGALLVMVEGEVVGIVSERDYARKVVLMGRSSRETNVREIMTPDVIALEVDQTVEHAMAVMTDNHIRHLPIHDQGKLIGIITIGDVVKYIIAEQEFMIGQLEKYIRQER